jgi:hypothetical protein
VKVSFSFRYVVIGGYLDRNGRTIHVYPLPFVRLTFR